MKEKVQKLLEEGDAGRPPQITSAKPVNENTAWAKRAPQGLCSSLRLAPALSRYGLGWRNIEKLDTAILALGYQLNMQCC